MAHSNPEQSHPALPRLDGVDLLRALAIFFVLMNHVNIRLRQAKVPWAHGLPDGLVHAFVWNGQLGVQIFFAVSGFLITATTLRRWGPLSQIHLREFYRLRFARIAPLLFLLLAVLSALHLARVPNFIVPAKTGGLARALFAALTFHINVLEANRGYLPANWDILWSLSVEELFYLFFPLLCRLFGRGRLLIAILLGFVALGPVARIVFAGSNEVWREYSYLGGMDAIALGCLTAIFLPRLRNRWVGLMGVALLALAICFPLRNTEMTLAAVGACLVIASAARSQWQSPRALAPVLTLGRRSYEIYLTHMFVVFACLTLFVRSGKPLPAVPVFFLASIVLATLLGELTARLYADPMNRRLRRTG